MGKRITVKIFAKQRFSINPGKMTIVIQPKKYCAVLPEMILAFIFVVSITIGPASAQQSFLIFPLQTIDQTAKKYPDSAFTMLKKNMIFHQGNKDREGEAVCLQKMGKVLRYASNYQQAMQKLLLADEIFRELGNKKMLAENLSDLGGVCYNNQQAEAAMLHFREAIAIYRELKDEYGMAKVLSQTGHLFEKQAKYDSAFAYQFIALYYARGKQEDQELFKIYENLGSIHEDLRQYDSARYYFTLSLKGFKKSGNFVDQAEVINNLGDIYYKSGDYINGLRYALMARDIAMETNEPYQLQSSYRDISQNYFELKTYDSAYWYLEKSRALIQSIYAKENSQQIALLQAIYDTDRKNSEIERLNALRKADDILKYGALVVLVLMTLLGILIFNRQKLKIKSEQLVNERNVEIFETQKGLMESELKRKKLEEESLKHQLEIKGRQLSSHILHLIQKNEVMEEIKTGLNEILKDEKRDQKKQVRQVLQKINFSFSQDQYWDDFRLIFDQVHPEFIPKLQVICPQLSATELRLLVLLKMNLGYSDMAMLLGITADSLRVMRYRIKKKLKLAVEDSLTSFIQRVV
jgi:tetratricopeptide (TPR) repeat protein